MRILAGDIGGTNIRLATYASGALSAVETTSNTGQTSVDEALSRYFATHGPFDGIGLGVAGPLRGDVITMTNQAVRLDVESLTSRFECPVRLVNDFHAQAVAMPHLSAEDRVALGPHAEPIPGHYAVLGAGTGLGEAFLIWTGTAHVAVAGEGSHGRFALSFFPYSCLRNPRILLLKSSPSLTKSLMFSIQSINSIRTAPYSW